MGAKFVNRTFHQQVWFFGYQTQCDNTERIGQQARQNGLIFVQLLIYNEDY
jgi:hypothetical protein